MSRVADAPGRAIRGVLFDKDGTLFDFQATWGGWASDLVAGLAPGEGDRQARLARAIRLDPARRRFLPDSPVIAGTVDDAIAAMLPELAGWDAGALRTHLIEASRDIRPAEAVPLAPLMARLSGAGIAVGVATNDDESAARAQFSAIGLDPGTFGFLAGADSGHGAKPEPGQCQAFAAWAGLAPGAVAMVGDSTHDLHAGQAAGMVRVAVLTGVAGADTLAPHADEVLPDIGHLPRWLGLPDAG